MRACLLTFKPFNENFWTTASKFNNTFMYKLIFFVVSLLLFYENKLSFLIVSWKNSLDLKQKLFKLKKKMKIK